MAVETSVSEIPITPQIKDAIKGQCENMAAGDYQLSGLVRIDDKIILVFQKTT